MKTYNNDLTNTIIQVSGDTEKHPSLKAMALALEVQPQRIYNVAKQPQEGREYNPREYNWDALNRYIGKRVEDKFDSLEAFVKNAFEIEETLSESDGRRGRRATGPKVDDVLLPDGSVIPGRKDKIAVGTKVMLKREPEPTVYEVVLFSETHAILQREGYPTLTSYSNWTFNQRAIVDEEQFEAIIAEREASLAKAKTEAAAKKAAPADNAPEKTKTK